MEKAMKTAIAFKRRSDQQFHNKWVIKILFLISSERDLLKKRAGDVIRINKLFDDANLFKNRRIRENSDAIKWRTNAEWKFKSPEFKNKLKEKVQKTSSRRRQRTIIWTPEKENAQK